MALKELELLTQELADLAVLYRQERRFRARAIIIERVKEIMLKIGKGFEE